MMKFLLAICLIPAVVFATPFRQCSGGRPAPASIQIEGCNALPCDIFAGAALVAHAQGIVSPVATPTLEAYITARLLGLEIDFTIPDELRNACANGISGGSCPITVGQTFDYTLNHPSLELPLTGITVQVEVGLIAANGATVTCVEIDANIRA